MKVISISNSDYIVFRLPLTMQRYDTQETVGGNWRYLAGIGESKRSDEVLLSLHNT